MLCEACGKAIGRHQRCLILSLGRRLRLGIAPRGQEAFCCSRACGCRVLSGEVFPGALADVPEGHLWPRFAGPRP